MGFNIKINGEKEILLEEHELTSVQFFSNVDFESNANTHSDTYVRIIGKILGPSDFASEMFKETNIENSKEMKIKNEELFKKNKQKIIAVSEWSLSFNKEDDYRNIEINVILGDEKIKTIVYPQAYIFSYNEDYNITTGDGFFYITIKQRPLHENEIKFI
jgi:hypothetical protein